MVEDEKTGGEKKQREKIFLGLVIKTIRGKRCPYPEANDGKGLGAAKQKISDRFFSRLPRCYGFFAGRGTAASMKTTAEQSCSKKLLTDYAPGELYNKGLSL